MELGQVAPLFELFNLKPVGRFYYFSIQNFRFFYEIIYLAKNVF
jgi:hypothetical protein